MKALYPAKRPATTYDYANNKELWRAWHIQRCYGLTLEQYDELVAKQQGVCKICGKAPPTRKGREQYLHVDHCHKTGVVRGLLCSSCNQGLGHFKLVAAILAIAATYLNDSLEGKMDQVRPKQYPCIETTIEFTHGPLRFRLWIDKDAVSKRSLAELDAIQTFIYWLDGYRPAADPDRTMLFEKLAQLPKINAAQVLEIGNLVGGQIMVGQVAYFVDFVGDVHG